MASLKKQCCIQDASVNTQTTPALLSSVRGEPQRLQRQPERPPTLNRLNAGEQGSGKAWSLRDVQLGLTQATPGCPPCLIRILIDQDADRGKGVVRVASLKAALFSACFPSRCKLLACRAGTLAKAIESDSLGVGLGAIPLLSDVVPLACDILWPNRHPCKGTL